MKLLVITPFPPLKAAEADHALHLCEHLAEHGLEVEVLTTRGSIKPRCPGISVFPIMRNWSWADFPRLVRFVKRSSADAVLLIHLESVYHFHPMITFAATVCKRFLPSAPFVTLCEDKGGCPWPTSLVTRAIRKLVSRWARAHELHFAFGPLLRDSDHLIVVSDRVRDGLACYCPDIKRKSVIIPSPPILRISSNDDGVTRQRRREALGLGPSDMLAVCFGYISPTKGVETLLHAFQRLASHRGDVKLAVVGGSINAPGATVSYLDRMRLLAQELGIKDKVFWTGEYEADSDEPSSYLWAADFCVLPYAEGICIHNSSLAAAAVHGLPVLATRGATLDEAFVDRQNVYLCPPKDSETMAVAMEALIEQPELRGRLRAGALRLAQEWFSWDRAIERTIATFGLSAARPASALQCSGV